MKPTSPITWVVARLENGCAILKNSTGELAVPRSQLPLKAKEGDLLTAEFYFLKDEKARKENLARAILEEILGKE